MGVEGADDTGNIVYLTREPQGKAKSIISDDPVEPGKHAKMTILELILVHSLEGRNSFRFSLRRMNAS